MKFNTKQLQIRKDPWGASIATNRTPDRCGNSSREAKLHELVNDLGKYFESLEGEPATRKSAEKMDLEVRTAGEAVVSAGQTVVSVTEERPLKSSQWKVKIEKQLSKRALTKS